MTFSRHQAVGAYRLWQPTAFDAVAEDALPQPAEAEAPQEQEAFEPEPPPELQIQLPTADDIEAMFEQARAEGHAGGYADGHAAGYAAGYAEGSAQSHDEAQRLAALVADVDGALARVDAEIADEVVALAVEIARRMVRDTLAADPGAVTETVKAALQQLPQNQVRIHVHPDDMALVRTHLADTLEHGHHRLVDDPRVARGGCRLEGSGSEVDATVQMRWRRILEGLGRPDAAAWEDE